METVTAADAPWLMQRLRTSMNQMLVVVESPAVQTAKTMVSAVRGYNDLVAMLQQGQSVILTSAVAMGQLATLDDAPERQVEIEELRALLMTVGQRVEETLNELLLGMPKSNHRADGADAAEVHRPDGSVVLRHSHH